MSNYKANYDHGYSPEQAASNAKNRAEASVRSGFTKAKGLPDAFTLVSMIEHKGTIIVCTTKHVYRLVDDVFQPMKFIFVDDAEDA